MSSASIPSIGIDAMGGDFAPAVPVEGAVRAIEESPATFEVHLVGRRDVVERELHKHRGSGERIQIVDATDVIGMSEKPLAAIRGKRKSSIRVGLADWNRLPVPGRVKAITSSLPERWASIAGKSCQ